MKDAEAQILRAFLYALTQQNGTLPQTAIQEMQAIATSLETRVVELHDLAVATPVLEPPYRTAYSWLTANAAERGLGLDFLPSKPDESIPTGEKPNIVRDVRSHLEEMQDVLTLIDQKLDQAPRILTSDNPGDTAQREFR